MTRAQEAYRETLERDPRWWAFRQEVFEHYGGRKCRGCGEKRGTIQVHHYFYRKGRKPWAYEHEEVVPFCPACHKAAKFDINPVDAGLGELLRVGGGKRVLSCQ